MAYKHTILDSDMHFVIDPVSRGIKNQSKKTSLIKDTHKSERFTFEIQRKIEGHDMSNCNPVEIHYKNGEDIDIYTVNDLQVCPDDDNVVIFSWLITENATHNVGNLKFAIHFLCDDYVFPTSAVNINIDDTINNTDTIKEKYLDIFERHDAQIIERDNLIKDSVESVTGESYSDVTEAVQGILDMANVFDEIELLITESGVIEYDDTFKD